MIKALLFDADGPLYKRGDEVTKQKTILLQKYDYRGDYQRFERAYDREKFKGYDRTETAEEMFTTIMATLGVQLDTESSKAFTSEFNKIQARIEPSPHSRDTLKQLHESGYKICVLTDSFYSAQEKWPWFQSLHMDAYIDEIVSSYDIRALKDTKNAYHVCLRLLSVKADQTLFVGHQQYEMDGAKKAGLISVCLTPIAIPDDTRGDYNIQSLNELEALVNKL